MAIIMNNGLMTFLYEKYRNVANIVVIIALLLGLNQRIYGYEAMDL